MTLPLFIGGERMVHALAAREQFDPVTIGLPSGRSLVLWTDVTSSGAVIRGRLLSNDGTAGPEFTVSDVTNSATAAVVTELEGGRFAVSFLAEASASSSTQIARVRFFDEDGNAAGASRAIPLFDANGRISARDPAIVTLENGDVVVAVRGASAGTQHLFAAIYGADGRAKGTPFSLDSGTAQRSQPELIARDGGGFMALWHQDTGGGNGTDIRARYFTDAGVPEGDAFTVNQTLTGGQTNADVAQLADGNFVVVWMSPEVGSVSSIRATVIDAVGNVVVKEFEVDTDSDGLSFVEQAEPKVAVLNDGRFIVTWGGIIDDDNQLGQNDIRARLFFANGGPASVEFAVPSSPTGHVKVEPDVTVLPDGLIRIVWRTSDPNGSIDTVNISTQLLDPRVGIIETIAGTDTGPRLLDPFDLTAVLQGGALNVVGTSAITMGNDRATNAQVIVDGAVNAFSVFAEADGLRLTGTTTGTAAGFGNHRLSVGDQGSIRANAGDGAVFLGRGNSMVNAGRIEARLDGVDAAGDGFVLSNLGTILGQTGLRVTGNTFDVQSADLVRGTQVGMALSGNLGRLRNTGDVIGQAGAGVDAVADTLVMSNTGAIQGSSSALRVTGGLLFLDNLGLLLGGTNGLDHVGSGGQITNSGTIRGANVGIDARNTTLLANDRVLIENAGTISGGGGGVRVTAKMIGLTNSGTILAGTSFGAMDGGIFASHGGRIVNHGEISAPGLAIHASFTFTRDGMVDNAAALVLRNTGDLLGDVATGAGADDVVNRGMLDGAVDLGGGVDVLRNSGTIIGAVTLGAGNDRMFNSGTLGGLVDLGEGNDSYEGSLAGAATVAGGIGSDTITGGQGDDDLRGGSGNDVLSGRRGDDSLSGDAGNDVLDGGAGDDVLRPGVGLDVVTTGAGADVIVFLTAAEAGRGATADTITDFTPGQDRIDLSAIAPGQTFIGAAAFGNVAGQVRYQQATGRLMGDVNGDGVLDYMVVLTGNPNLTAGDLIL